MNDPWDDTAFKNLKAHHADVNKWTAQIESIRSEIDGVLNQQQAFANYPEHFAQDVQERTRDALQRLQQRLAAAIEERDTSVSASEWEVQALSDKPALAAKLARLTTW